MGNEAISPGSDTELINPQEIAAMAARPPKGPRHAPNPQDPQDNKIYIKIIIGSLSVLIVFAIIVWIIAGIHNKHQQELAQDRTVCEQTLASLEQKIESYEHLRDIDSQEAVKISEDDVADTQTVVLLDKQLSAKTPEYVNCSVATKEQFEQQISIMNDNAEWYDAHTASLQEAIDNVTASKSQKQLDTKREELTTLLDQARTLSSQNQGKVADNAVLIRLNDAIVAAQNTTESDDLDAIDDAKTTVQQAMDDVKSSHNQKVADDQRKEEEARQKAEEEKKKAEEEAKQKAEEAKKKAEEEARKKAQQNQRH